MINGHVDTEVGIENVNINGVGSRKSVEGKTTREILETFADRTTLHGIPRATLAKSFAMRCLWTAIFLVAASMFFYQLYTYNNNNKIKF